jgi:uncharacterized protein RhaS with RHS repeats
LTAQHYNYFRDYDPSLGRYIESDPIGLRGGKNTYAYVASSPLMLTDPLGQYDSRMRGAPGNDPYPGCSGNDPMCRGGMSRPPKPDPGGQFDPGCFAQCLIFGKTAETVSMTILIDQGASRLGGTIAEGVGQTANQISKNPGLIGISALYGIDYCRTHCYLKGCKLGTDFTTYSPLTQGVPF